MPRGFNRIVLLLIVCRQHCLVPGVVCSDCGRSGVLRVRVFLPGTVATGDADLLGAVERKRKMVSISLSVQEKCHATRWSRLPRREKQEARVPRCYPPPFRLVLSVVRLPVFVVEGEEGCRAARQFDISINRENGCVRTASSL